MELKQKMTFQTKQHKKALKEEKQDTSKYT